jgi:hypothetical protein
MSSTGERKKGRLVFEFETLMRKQTKGRKTGKQASKRGKE